MAVHVLAITSPIGNDGTLSGPDGASDLELGYGIRLARLEPDSNQAGPAQALTLTFYVYCPLVRAA